MGEGDSLKQRVIKNRQDRTSAIEAIMRIDYPYVISVGREKQESSPQRRRYFALVDEWITEIKQHVDAASETSGYTPYEVRQIIHRELDYPQSALMASLDKTTAHNIIKLICGIPTSKGIGTKKFKNLETIMEATLSDVLGTVRKITGKMV